MHQRARRFGEMGHSSSKHKEDKKSRKNTHSRSLESHTAPPHPSSVHTSPLVTSSQQEECTIPPANGTRGGQSGDCNVMSSQPYMTQGRSTRSVGHQPESKTIQSAAAVSPELAVPSPHSPPLRVNRTSGSTALQFQAPGGSCGSSLAVTSQADGSCFQRNRADSPIHSPSNPTCDSNGDLGVLPVSDRAQLSMPASGTTNAPCVPSLEQPLDQKQPQENTRPPLTAINATDTLRWLSPALHSVAPQSPNAPQGVILNVHHSAINAQRSDTASDTAQAYHRCHREDTQRPPPPKYAPTLSLDLTRREAEPLSIPSQTEADAAEEAETGSERPTVSPPPPSVGCLTRSPQLWSPHGIGEQSVPPTPSPPLDAPQIPSSPPVQSEDDEATPTASTVSSLDNYLPPFRQFHPNISGASGAQQRRAVSRSLPPPSQPLRSECPFTATPEESRGEQGVSQPRPLQIVSQLGAEDRLQQQPDRRSCCREYNHTRPLDGGSSDWLIPTEGAEDKADSSALFRNSLIPLAGDEVVPAYAFPEEYHGAAHTGADNGVEDRESTHSGRSTLRLCNPPMVALGAREQLHTRWRGRCTPCSARRDDSHASEASASPDQDEGYQTLPLEEPTSPTDDLATAHWPEGCIQPLIGAALSRASVNNDSPRTSAVSESFRVGAEVTGKGGLRLSRAHSRDGTSPTNRASSVSADFRSPARTPSPPQVEIGPIAAAEPWWNRSVRVRSAERPPPCGPAPSQLKSLAASTTTVAVGGRQRGSNSTSDANTASTTATTVDADDAAPQAPPHFPTEQRREDRPKDTAQHEEAEESAPTAWRSSQPFITPAAVEALSPAASHFITRCVQLPLEMLIASERSRRLVLQEVEDELFSYLGLQLEHVLCAMAVSAHCHRWTLTHLLATTWPVGAESPQNGPTSELMDGSFSEMTTSVLSPKYDCSRSARWRRAATLAAMGPTAVAGDMEPPPFHLSSFPCPTVGGEYKPLRLLSDRYPPHTLCTEAEVAEGPTDSIHSSGVDAPHLTLLQPASVADIGSTRTLSLEIDTTALRELSINPLESECSPVRGSASPLRDTPIPYADSLLGTDRAVTPPEDHPHSVPLVEVSDVSKPEHTRLSASGCISPYPRDRMVCNEDRSTLTDGVFTEEDLLNRAPLAATDTLQVPPHAPPRSVKDVAPSLSVAAFFSLWGADAATLPSVQPETDRRLKWSLQGAANALQSVPVPIHTDVTKPTVSTSLSREEEPPQRPAAVQAGRRPPPPVLSPAPEAFLHVEDVRRLPPPLLVGFPPVQCGRTPRRRGAAERSPLHYPRATPGQDYCPWCDRLYTASGVCPVVQRPHDVLHAEQERERRIKQAAQLLLRSQRIPQAVNLLASAGLCQMPQPRHTPLRSPDMRVFLHPAAGEEEAVKPLPIPPGAVPYRL